MFVDRGLGVEAGIWSYDGNITPSVRVGVVAHGVEVGVFGQRSEDPERNDALVTYTIGPVLSLYPLRQSETMPLSVRLRLAYGFLFFQGELVDLIEDLEDDITGSYLEGEALLFIRAEISPTFQLIPQAGVQYRLAEVEVSGTFIRPFTVSDDGIGVVLGMGLHFTSPTTATSFAFVPRVVFPDEFSDESQVALDLKMQMIFGF